MLLTYWRKTKITNQVKHSQAKSLMCWQENFPICGVRKIRPFSVSVQKRWNASTFLTFWYHKLIPKREMELQDFYWHPLACFTGPWFISKYVLHLRPTCAKGFRIWSYSSPYFPAFGLNADQNNSEYGHFLRSATYLWGLGFWNRFPSLHLEYY